VLLPKIKKNPKNTNGRLAIPALAGLLVITNEGLLSLCSSGNVGQHNAVDYVGKANAIE